MSINPLAYIQIITVIKSNLITIFMTSTLGVCTLARENNFWQEKKINIFIMKTFT